MHRALVQGGLSSSQSRLCLSFDLLWALEQEQGDQRDWNAQATKEEEGIVKAQ